MEKEKAKRKNLQYSAQDMAKAIAEVKSEARSCYSAAKFYNVPLSTLIDRVKGTHDGLTGPGARTTLSIDEENALADWAVEWASMGQPLTMDQLKKAATKLSKAHQKGEKTFANDGMIPILCPMKI